jgi:hypothetical protein
MLHQIQIDYLRSSRLILICCLLPALVVLSASGQTRPSNRSGAISGRVMTEDGQPVDGATIQLSGGSTSKTATADVDGNFSITGLTPTVYRIYANSPGYVTPLEFGGLPSIARIGETINLTLVKGGVITGRVTDSNGEPVVAVTVNAIRVRDSEGNAVQNRQNTRQRQTDDRGVYRLYGLAAGSYVVVANPTSGDTYRATGYDQETPTYYPSSARDGASEVTVQLGAEASGIDIRYRNLRGHAISGSIDGTFSNDLGFQVELQAAGGGGIVGYGYAQPTGDVRSFYFDGLPDGDYDLIAQGSNQEESFISTPRRISLRGADITGVRLAVTPMATIAGKVVVETAALPEDCQRGRQAALAEVYIQPWREAKSSEVEPFSYYAGRQAAGVKEAGDFLLRHLIAGQYRIDANLPSENWYLKALTMPSPSAARRTIDLGRIGLAIKNGEKVTGLTMTVAEGAAGVTGKIEGDKFKRNTSYRVHFVPVDPAQADQQLLYYEILAKADGSFSFSNLAPGKYWAVARPLADDQVIERQGKTVASDAAERAKLRREAEAAKQEIELKTCQRMKDYALKLP